MTSFDIRGSLFERGLRAPILFRLDARAEKSFEETFFYQAIDRRVVNDSLEIKFLHRIAGLSVHGMVQHVLDGGGREIRYAFVGIRFLVRIVNTLDVGGIVGLVVLDV